MRRSAIHGRGVFAARRIPAETRIIEYRGERISRSEAAHRYAEDSGEIVLTLIFEVDDDTVIDPGRGGNAARYINHSCEPNCEARLDDRGRVFIWALRDLRPGEELTYDYNVQPGDRRRRNWAASYECRCGARRCRGSMLDPALAPRRRASARGR